jgi:hypothetical protein
LYSISLSGWRLRLWHISSHSSHFSYRHSSPMTTPSPAHSVVVCVVIFPFVVALLPFQWWDDRGDGRKDRPFVGRDLRDEMTWIIITAARLMFLFFFFFLSNRKLVGTNVSPHFLFLSHPHGHPRTSAFFSPADFLSFLTGRFSSHVSNHLSLRVYFPPNWIPVLPLCWMAGRWMNRQTSSRD